MKIEQATASTISDWNDRRKSKGHLGIPLISSAFVGAIPMISRLLRELGVPIDWVDSHDSEIIKKTVGQSAGLFFVDDAASATDHQGRKIIAAAAQRFPELLSLVGYIWPKTQRLSLIL